MQQLRITLLFSGLKIFILRYLNDSAPSRGRGPESKTNTHISNKKHNEHMHQYMMQTRTNKKVKHYRYFYSSNKNAARRTKHNFHLQTSILPNMQSYTLKAVIPLDLDLQVPTTFSLTNHVCAREETDSEDDVDSEDAAEDLDHVLPRRSSRLRKPRLCDNCD